MKHPRALLILFLLGTACSRPESAPGPDPLGPSPAEVFVSSDPPAGPGSLAPRLSDGAHGPLLSWLEPDPDGGHGFFVSRFEREGWSRPEHIATADDAFANWADLPAVAEATDGHRTAHWLRKLGNDTYAYGAHLLRAAPGGEWEESGWLHDDTSPTEHGFVSYAARPEGGLQAFWLDGRAMLDGGSMQLRTSTVTREGAGASVRLDDRVCECCATDAAFTDQGPIVVYRDRDPEEIRDLAVVRATANGWSSPTYIATDGWQIHGCPVNGPAVAARGARVVVAWFSAPDGRARVRMAVSDDSGARFAPPIPIDTEAPIGRVDVALAASGDAFVSWMARAGDRAEIRWRRVAPDGEAGTVHSLVETSAERAAGVPQMTLYGEDLIFAWVEPGEPTRLRSRRVPIR